MKKRVLMVLMVLAIAIAVYADPQADAHAASQAKNYSVELKIVQPLAQKGEAWAQKFLGVMYYNGQGVPQDYAQAAKWFLKAANQGFSDAQIILGVMYDTGHGVPQDYAQAYLWLDLAASKCTADEKDARDGVVALRDTVATQMTPDQLALAQKMAFEWKPVK